MPAYAFFEDDSDPDDVMVRREDIEASTSEAELREWVSVFGARALQIGEALRAATADRAGFRGEPAGAGNPAAAGRAQAVQDRRPETVDRHRRGAGRARGARRGEIPRRAGRGVRPPRAGRAVNGVAKILLGVAAVIAAWKFGKAAQHVASGWNERLEAQADAIYAYGGGLGADGDDEPTVH